MRKSVLVSASLVAVISASPASAKYPVPFTPTPTLPAVSKACGFEINSNLPANVVAPAVKPTLSTKPKDVSLPRISRNDDIAPILISVPKNQEVIIKLSVPCPSKAKTIVIGTSTTSSSGALQLPALGLDKPSSYDIDVVFPDKRIAGLTGKVK